MCVCGGRCGGRCEGVFLDSLNLYVLVYAQSWCIHSKSGSRCRAMFFVFSLVMENMWMYNNVICWRVVTCSCEFVIWWSWYKLNFTLWTNISGTRKPSNMAARFRFSEWLHSTYLSSLFCSFHACIELRMLYRAIENVKPPGGISKRALNNYC